MEKTLEIHLQEQQNLYVSLLAKYAVERRSGDWHIPAQTALDIISGVIKE